MKLMLLVWGLRSRTAVSEQRAGGGKGAAGRSHGCGLAGLLAAVCVRGCQGCRGTRRS